MTCSRCDGLAREVARQRLERRRAEALGVDRDRRQRRREHAREVEVVEADDRQVPRDPDAALAGGQVDAAGEDVVVAEDRGEAALRRAAGRRPRRRPRT